ncbi:DnaD domain-containing protein [Sporolactobacillus vineae]|uniref:DnaD domain-containing protein n=1 Tax=Sporolactobacillus vineae TaxID=444463 RepID=UPI000289CDF4|nr:DnaD domain-containing protein [Sporolactobacillus vineae]
MDAKFLTRLMMDSQLNIPSLLIEHYNEIGLNEQECMLLIEVHSFITHGDEFPTFENLSARMTLSETECADMLHDMVQHGFLSIVQKTENELYTEAYSLQPLWEKLIRFAYREQTSSAPEATEKTLYTLFETEFGRPLSPIECETLAMWTDDDHQSPAMIKAALREAVVSGKLNFRYIDRILFEWKKNGIKTAAQAKAHGDQIRRRQPAGRMVKPGTADHTEKKPDYDWLDQD